MKVPEDPMLVCTRYAFRLETLSSYAGGSTGESFRRYQELGEAPRNTHWAAMVDSVRQRGCEVKRLRLISEPPSPYESFEIQVGYSAGLDAGEDIRLAPRALLSSYFDFWAYDDEWIEELTYADDGDFITSVVRRVEAEDLKMIRHCMQVFDTSRQL